MTKARIATVLGLELAMLAAMLVVVLDQYAHTRVQVLGGVNSWGYRGPVAKQRVFDETRLVMVGGTQAFGFGVATRETTTSYLRYLVEAWVTFDRGPVTAFNIASLGLPRGAYAARLEHFRYLAPDLICVYVDLAPNPTAVLHARRSGVERLTGYVPALPVVLPEKGDRMGGVTGSAARLAGRALAFADTQLARIAPEPPPVSDEVTAAVDAVELAAGMAPSTVVVVPEPQSAAAADERDRLLAALNRFAGDARVRIVTLGQRFPGYRERLLPDGVNLGSTGQYNAAQEIDTVASEMLRARRTAVKPS